MDKTPSQKKRKFLATSLGEWFSIIWVDQFHGRQQVMKKPKNVCSFFLQFNCTRRWSLMTWWWQRVGDVVRFRWPRSERRMEDMQNTYSALSPRVHDATRVHIILVHSTVHRCRRHRGTTSVIDFPAGAAWRRFVRTTRGYIGLSLVAVDDVPPV